MEYYSVIKRNTFESVLMRWMNLEPIKQSEVSQKEKDKYCVLMHIWTSLVAQMVKRLPTMQETRVQSLSGEDLLEEGMATYSSILAWRIPRQRSLEGYSPWGRKESGTTEVTEHTYMHASLLHTHTRTHTERE